ncbi:osmotically inducible protein OsmC [Terrimicrobium sacchariphilum]|jgi:osmotically inducible protein OsmC|uniref:Osmotically inducible protein OsmC n=1 Tax=Terrimicrobium sacchariphilum TaxID=690879 RepID=A0A146G1N1_TERSA|nr:OsmC family protein [Terrimicrobium sacchariphilum]GAT31560.1 osmotically inducible protein OsmC [Terrimicrobium sacchariphilum]
MITNTASAHWEGNLNDGKGTITTKSKVLDQTPYSFKARFENGSGTNPEELIAAAHAGCFTMALSLFLGNAGFTPKALNTTAEVILEQVKSAWAVTKVHLSLEAEVPGIDAEKFDELAAFAKANCPISKLLNATITLDAKLIS